AEDGIRDFHVTGVQTCALPIFSSGRSASPRRRRNTLAAAPRSGAVSASVPSKSKRTSLVIRRRLLAGREQIVHRGIGGQGIDLGDRVVFHAGKGVAVQAGLPYRRGQLAGLDETFEIV